MGIFGFGRRSANDNNIGRVVIASLEELQKTLHSNLTIIENLKLQKPIPVVQILKHQADMTKVCNQVSIQLIQNPLILIDKKELLKLQLTSKEITSELNRVIVQANLLINLIKKYPKLILNKSLEDLKSKVANDNTEPESNVEKIY